jgi:hypothetical protein
LRPKRFKLLDKIFDDLSVFCPFSGGDPGHLKSLGLKADILQESFDQVQSPAGIEIALDIMTIARMTARDENSVSAFIESGENIKRRDASGTHDLDRDDIGRIFHPGNTGQVASRRGTPFAEKSHDLGFKFLRHR